MPSAPPVPTPIAGVPYWVPLVVGIAVGVLGLLGVLYTQWRSDRRETAQWERQQAAQREQWAREDAARSFEQRRESYLRYFTEFDQVWEVVAGRYYLPGHWPEPVPEDDRTYGKLYEELRTLKLFSSKRVADLAEEALTTLRGFDQLEAHRGENDGEAEEINGQLRISYDRLRDLMREDLGVPVETHQTERPAVARQAVVPD